MYEAPYMDEQLFSKRMLEGEYTTWAFVWARDMGVAAALDGIIVDNYGNVYVIDSSVPTAWVISFLNALTTIANYGFWILMEVIGWSITKKYVLGTRGAFPTEFDVYRDGAYLFRHDTAGDQADNAGVSPATISPNGKFVAVIINSIAGGNNRYVLLYEGT